MFTFSANLSTLFIEVPFQQRFERAKSSGFSHIECQFPYELTVEEIRKQLELYQLQFVLFNLSPGNWGKGERGISILPNRIQEFKQSVEEGIRYASALQVPKLHCMAGVLPSNLDKEEARHVFKENLLYAAREFQKHDLTLMIEPINTLDIPGYFLSNLNDAVSLIDELSQPNIKLQFDFYHIQRMQGELLTSFNRLKNYIGHVQIADNPGRHEPGTGEINYRNIFSFLKQEGYNQIIGLEYIPKGKSEESFSWMKNKQ